MKTIQKKRFMDAVETAREAFWESIAKQFPEIKTGDLDPMSTFAFDVATKGVVKTWIESNGGRIAEK